MACLVSEGYRYTDLLIGKNFLRGGRGDTSHSSPRPRYVAPETLAFEKIGYWKDSRARFLWDLPRSPAIGRGNFAARPVTSRMPLRISAVQWTHPTVLGCYRPITLTMIIVVSHDHDQCQAVITPLCRMIMINASPPRLVVTPQFVCFLLTLAVSS